MSSPLQISAATRLDADAFASGTQLGRSLALPVHAGLERCLSFANSAPLAHTFNRGLAEAHDDSLVLFCHDDLWLGEAPLEPALSEALQSFDLVGQLRLGDSDSTSLGTHGPSPDLAVLLDGVFLAGRAGVLRRAGLAFDPQLPFYFYDLDFCRAAEQAGLRIGIGPRELIRFSGGPFPPTWRASQVLYQHKWEPLDPAPVGEQALRHAYALARAHQLLSHWHEALAGYDAVLALDPQHPRALQQRALVLHQLERPHEALASLNQALALDPNNATALSNRAILQEQLVDPVGTEASLRQALALSPHDSELAYRLAKLLVQLQRPLEAVEALRVVLRLDAHHEHALLQLGALLMELEQFGLARSAFRRVLARHPHHSQALFGLGQCLECLGDPEAALATFCRGLELANDDLDLLSIVEGTRLALCLWDDHDARMAHLAARLETHLADGDGDGEGEQETEKEKENEKGSLAVPMRLLGLPLPLEIPRRVGARHAEQIVRAMAPLRLEPASPAPLAGRPLRIGYLSADFRCHAMGGLIHGLFAHHDRSRCVPIGYMLAGSHDRYTRSVAQGCERLRDASRLGSGDLARCIRDDGIDVLVDLMGYSHQGRPSVLALRPAPLQLHYLGYPASTGAPFLDGIVADPWLIPEALERGYSERVLRLPHAFVCSPILPAEPGEPLPPLPTRAALNLAPDQMVFACFNRSVKFDPHRFALWMEILRAVPGSALLLVVADASTRKRLGQRAHGLGVDPERLVFAPRSPAAQFPELCRLADLFLDTPHYGAGATGAMGLQAGLPLLTCPGESFLSRMGASLCAAVAMEDLICADGEVYRDQAIALGRDRAQLQERRARLLDPASSLPLFDTAGWVRHWEQLLQGLVGG
jgi:predicted O-linked N-acetylglucosamine transferase (SPINDLY family)